MLEAADSKALNTRYSLAILLVGLIIAVSALTGGIGMFRDTQSVLIVGVLVLTTLTLAIGAPVRAGSAHWVFLGLIVLYAISTATSSWWSESVLEVGLLVGYLALFFLGANLIGGERRRLALHVLMAAGTAVAVVALYQHLIGREPQIASLKALGFEAQARQLSAMAGRAFGSFPTANGLAGFLILLIPIALGLLAYERDNRLRAWLLVATATMGATLYFSASRGAMISLAVGLAVAAVLWLLRSGRVRLAGTVMPIAIAAVGVAFFGLFFGFRAETFSRLLSGRLEFWEAALHMASDNPWLGVGPGAFGTAMTEYQVASEYSRFAHNSYLQTAAEVGWPGLIVFLILIGAILTGAFRRYRALDERSALMILGTICGLVAVSFHNTVDYSWYMPASALAFWFIAGLALGDDGKTAEKSSAATPARALIILVLLIGLIGPSMVAVSQSDVVTAKSSYGHHVSTHGGRYEQSGQAETIAGIPSEELAEQERLTRMFMRAARLFPYNSDLWDTYARFLYEENQRGHGGSLKKAARLQKKAISLRPTWPYLYLRLARINEALPDDRSAGRAYESAISHGPLDPRVYAENGFFHLRADRPGEALEVFEAGVALSEIYDPNGNRSAADFSSARGDGVQPLREIGRAYYGATLALVELGRNEDGAQTIVEAERLLGRTPETILAHGRIWEARGKYGRAASAYRQVAYSAGAGGVRVMTYPEVAWDLASVLEKAGKKGQALAEAKTLLEAFPDNVAARELIERLEAP